MNVADKAALNPHVALIDRIVAQAIQLSLAPASILDDSREYVTPDQCIGLVDTIASDLARERRMRANAETIAKNYRQLTVLILLGCSCLELIKAIIS